MTTSPWETRDEYIRRMATKGGGGLASEPEVEANIRASFVDLGTLFFDEASIPPTASVRPAGSFFDAYAMREYLDSGGLITVDNNNNIVIPQTFVYILESFDEVMQEYRYTVYIDENS